MIGGVLVVLVAIGAVLFWRNRPVDEGAMVRDGRALAQIREQVDGRRICAPLLGGNFRWTERWYAPEAKADSVEALVAAGILSRRPDGLEGSQRVRYFLAPTPGGSRDIVYDVGSASARDTSPPSPYLCYGRMQVADIHVRVARGSAVDPNDGQVTYSIDHRFRVVDMPDWTKRADIRAAFPFLDRVRRGVPVQAGETAILRGRRFTLSTPVEISWPKDPDIIFEPCNVRPPPKERDYLGADGMCAQTIR